MAALEDFWIKATAFMANGFLMTIVPIAKATNIDFDDVLLSKSNLDSALVRHNMKEDFLAGKISCSCCKQKLDYRNLGGINEASSSIEMTCLNPGCSIKL